MRIGFRRYKLLFYIATAFISALIYDNYRNSDAKKSELDDLYRPSSDVVVVSIKNPTSLKKPENEKLGEPQPIILKATDIFLDFKKDEKRARGKYIDKTFFIRGLIAEIFEIKAPFEGRGVVSWDELSVSWDELYESHPLRLTAGIMLLPETEENQRSLLNPEQEGVSLIPRVRAVSMSRSGWHYKYREFLNSKSSKLQIYDYYSYSDDFSYESEFGGVYCMFSNRFYRKIRELRDDVPYEIEKRKVMVLCKIIDYKKGGLEEVEDYLEPKLVLKDGELALEAKKSKVETKPRIIAAGCKEENYSANWK